MGKYYVVTTVYKRKKSAGGGSLLCLLLLILFIYGLGSGIDENQFFILGIFVILIFKFYFNS